MAPKQDSRSVYRVEYQVDATHDGRTEHSGIMPSMETTDVSEVTCAMAEVPSMTASSMRRKAYNIFTSASELTRIFETVGKSGVMEERVYQTSYSQTLARC